MPQHIETKANCRRCALSKTVSLRKVNQKSVIDFCPKCGALRDFLIDPATAKIVGKE